MSKQPHKERQKVPAASATANTDTKSEPATKELKTRERILNMLSDTEMARVSSAETAKRLEEGEEYLDLEQLEQGVKKADGASSPMGQVLPKRSVRDETWTQILTQLPMKAPAAKTSRVESRS